MSYLVCLTLPYLFCLTLSSSSVLPCRACLVLAGLTLSLPLSLSLFLARFTRGCQSLYLNLHLIKPYNAYSGTSDVVQTPCLAGDGFLSVAGFPLRAGVVYCRLPETKLALVKFGWKHLLEVASTFCIAWHGVENCGAFVCTEYLTERTGRLPSDCLGKYFVGGGRLTQNHDD